jgi:hypothetical protein
LGHQALLLPNIAIDVLVPSMGGCVSVHGTGFAVAVVCPGRLPRLDATDLVRASGSAIGGTRPPPLSRPMPFGYLALALVPAVATIWGGRSAASRVERPEDRLAAGVASGVVFALLIGAASWLAGVTLRLESSVTLGPRPLLSVMLALAWGVAGGVVGALLARRQLPVVPEDEPAPPRPTSV